MDWHELSKKKVTELREMAQEQGMQGTSGLHKDQLLPVLAEMLGIERPHKVAEGAGKKEIKAKIRELKRERVAALEAGDREKLLLSRRKIHRLKRKARRMARLKS